MDDETLAPKPIKDPVPEESPATPQADAAATGAVTSAAPDTPVTPKTSITPVTPAIRAAGYGTGAGGGEVTSNSISAQDPAAINNNLEALAAGTVHLLR